MLGSYTVIESYITEKILPTWSNIGECNTAKEYNLRNLKISRKKVT